MRFDLCVKRTCRGPTVAIAVASLAGVAMSARGAIINYAPPPLVGTDVTYPTVSESSSTSTLPLYGAPMVSGDSLVFANLNFAAVSTNGTPPLDFVDGQINFTLQANPGTFLQTLDLTEFGDYNVSTTPANPEAQNYVEAYENYVQITVLAIDGVAVTPVTNNTEDPMSITDGGIFQNNPGPVPQTVSGSWSGAADANLAMIFGSSQITEIAVSFDNQLLAESQTGGIADIAKKGFDIVPGTGTGGPGVPEPAVGTLLMGTFGVGLARRKRRSAN
jgi:hypothetical protein